MSESFSCIILDDEQDAVDLLATRISYLYGNIVIKDSFTMWQDALVALRNNQYDLLFCDVSMPGKSGIDLLKLLPGLQSEIIFVTAHDNYAIDAFSLSASGYILKPIDDTELSTAINKSTERIRNKKLAQHSLTTTQKLNDKVKVPNKHGVDYVNVSEILYLESINKCTHIVTAKAKYTSSANIGTYKNLLDNPIFFQVHRLFIINLNCVLRHETSGLIIMQDKKEIPLSRNIKHDFLKLFSSM
jgi:two-component system, LytTR family, response regulator